MPFLKEKPKVTSTDLNNNNNSKKIEFPWSGDDAQQGARDSMEDSHHRFDTLSVFHHIYHLKKKHIGYYAVHDGHGGDEVALELEKTLHHDVIGSPAFNTGDYIGALKEGFEKSEAHMIKQSEINQWTSGSTCVCLLVTKRKFYGANVGDAEAILARETENGLVEPIELTHKHKPNDEEEKKRIQEAGGHVIFGRVNGSLAVARSFGDIEQKFPFNKGNDHFVSPVPHIIDMDRNPKDAFLVVSCDGLWERMTYEDCLGIVSAYWISGRSPEAAAREIVRVGIAKGSRDNVTAIVVYLRPPPKIDFKSIELKESDTKMKAEVSKILAAAYFDDPKYRTLAPDNNDREKMLSVLFDANIDWFLKYGVVFVLLKSGIPVATSVWFAPAKKGTLKSAKYQAAMIKVASTAFSTHFGRNEYLVYIEQIERDWKLMGGDQSWTLWFWAVKPGETRKGYGRQVLEAGLQKANNEHHPKPIFFTVYQKKHQEIFEAQWSFVSHKELKGVLGPYWIIKQTTPKPKNKMHHFVAKTFPSESKVCAVCTLPIWGIINNGFECAFCKMVVHKDCRTKAEGGSKCGASPGKWEFSNKATETSKSSKKKEREFEEKSLELIKKARDIPTESTAKKRLSGEVKRTTSRTPLKHKSQSFILDSLRRPIKPDEKSESKDKKSESKDKKSESKDKKSESKSKKSESKDKKSESKESKESKDKKSESKDKKSESKDKKSESKDKNSESKEGKESKESMDSRGEKKEKKHKKEKKVRSKD